MSRYIEEYVPLAWFGTSSAIIMFALEVGIFLASIMGFVLPHEEDTEALKETQSWIYIFAVQPIMCTLSIILFYVYVGNDTPRFYISRGMDDTAKQVI